MGINTRVCNRKIVIAGEETGDCHEITPSSKSPMCYWHRLDRTRFDGQARAAEARLAAAEAPHRKRVPPQEWPVGKRWCSGCQSMVPIWYCQGSKCKACTRMAAQAARRRETYGLSDGLWDVILELQGGRCAICRNRQRDRSPAVEHDHSINKVRGGCCVRCNHDLLGAAHDSPLRLLSALMYLLAPPTSGRWIPPEHGAGFVMQAVVDALETLYNDGRAPKLMINIDDDLIK